MTEAKEGPLELREKEAKMMRQRRRRWGEVPPRVLSGSRSRVVASGPDVSHGVALSGLVASLGLELTYN